MIRYVWPDFTLEHDPQSGYTVTVYPDGHQSGCGVVHGDRHHAPLLGITPERHRLAHELMHHLCAMHRGYLDGREGGCRIVWRDAFQKPQVQPEASLDEWYITAATALLYGRDPDDYGALLDLRREGVDVAALLKEARWLLSAADLPGDRTITLQPPGVEVARAA